MLYRIWKSGGIRTMAGICSAAMITVQGADGISHNPKEYIADENIAAEANVLFDTVIGMTC